MDCSEIQKMMTDSLAGELSPEQASILDQHLASCDDCRREFDEMKKIWDLTKISLSVDKFDEKLTDKQHEEIQKAIDESPKPQTTQEQVIKFSEKRRQERRRTGISFAWMEIAASLVILVIVVGTVTGIFSDRVRTIVAGASSTFGANDAADAVNTKSVEIIQTIDADGLDVSEVIKAEPKPAYQKTVAKHKLNLSKKGKVKKRVLNMKSPIRYHSPETPVKKELKEELEESTSLQYSATAVKAKEKNLDNRNQPDSGAAYSVTKGDKSRDDIEKLVLSATAQSGEEAKEQFRGSEDDSKRSDSLRRRKAYKSRIMRRMVKRNGKTKSGSNSLLGARPSDAPAAADDEAAANERQITTELTTGGGTARSSLKKISLGVMVDRLENAPKADKDKGIIRDKNANHTKYGNVLFLDGHVKGYAGTDFKVAKDASASTPQTEREGGARPTDKRREEGKPRNHADTNYRYANHKGGKESSLRPTKTKEDVVIMEDIVEGKTTVAGTTSTGKKAQVAAAPRRAPKSKLASEKDALLSTSSRDMESKKLGRTSDLTVDESDKRGLGVEVKAEAAPSGDIAKGKRDKELDIVDYDQERAEPEEARKIYVAKLKKGEETKSVAKRLPGPAKPATAPVPPPAETKMKPPVIKDLQNQTFTLNLKLWDLTTEKNVKELLRKKKIDVQSIKVDKKKNTIIIRADATNLKKAGKLFEELRNSEEKLEDTRKGLPMIDTASKPVSTFSIDVDTASYTMARKELRKGYRPAPEKIRPEEFVNYFDYHYPSPSNGRTFGVYMQAAPSPFRPNHVILRIGVQGKKLGPDTEHASAFTILVDTSGSMYTKDRINLVKKSIKMLLDQMRPNDRISLLTCGSQANYLLGNTPVRNRKIIDKTIDAIKSEGETNIENGIIKAYQIARSYYLPGAFNRVIIFSDGIVDAGSQSADVILAQVEAARKQGISNTVIGVGGDGNDALMEALANKGDGNYVFIDNDQEAEKVFKDQFSARFREIARDVKIQVEFNPEIVAKYRQIGYQNRQLSKADFRNDKVDAGEVGAGQSVTALYELKLTKHAFDDTEAILATVRLRYKQHSTLQVKENEYLLTVNEIKRSYQKTEPNFRLAVSIAEFAEFLRYPEAPGIANPDFIAKQLSELTKRTYSHDGKVTELCGLMRANF